MLDGYDPAMLARAGGEWLRMAATLLAQERGEVAEDVVARAFELVDPAEAGDAALRGLEARLEPVMAATSEILLSRAERPREGLRMAARRPLDAWIAAHPLEVIDALLGGVQRLLAARLDDA